MKKKWVAVIMCMCLLQIVPMNLKAEEQTDMEQKLYECIEDEGIEILSVETEQLNEDEISQYIVAEDKNGNDLEFEATLETMEIEQDGVIKEMHVLTAERASKKYSIRKNNSYNATICWIDNLGPNNQLVYVGANWPAGLYSTQTNYYHYWKTGFYNTTVYGSWVGMNLYQEVSNYKGLGFTLVVNVGSESLEVSTSITD